MTVLFRSIVVWLVLLALPYQGYAAAQMMLCVAPAQVSASHAEMVMPSGPHDHAAMMALQAEANAGDIASANAEAPAKAGEGAASHTGMKCSGAACCVAVAPVLTLEIAEPALPVASRVIPFYSGFLPAVDLAHPERPPQAHHA